MISALVHGTLHGEPVRRTAKNGGSFVTVMVRTALDNGDSMFVSVISFELAVIEGLLRLSGGDAVCLSGQFSPKVYMNANGDSRASADLIAHGLLTPYQVKRKRGG